MNTAFLIITLLGQGTGAGATTTSSIIIKDMPDYNTCLLVGPHVFKSVVAADQSLAGSQLGVDARCVDGKTGKSAIIKTRDTEE